MINIKVINKSFTGCGSNHSPGNLDISIAQTIIKFTMFIPQKASLFTDSQIYRQKRRTQQTRTDDVLVVQLDNTSVLPFLPLSTYGSPSCIPPTTNVFQRGLKLDLLLQRTLVIQENRLLGVYWNPSFKHSSSILKAKVPMSFLPM